MFTVALSSFNKEMLSGFILTYPKLQPKIIDCGFIENLLIPSVSK